MPLVKTPDAAYAFDGAQDKYKPYASLISMLTKVNINL